jgi:hypothetical protein
MRMAPGPHVTCVGIRFVSRVRIRVMSGLGLEFGLGSGSESGFRLGLRFGFSLSLIHINCISVVSDWVGAHTCCIGVGG